MALRCAAFLALGSLLLAGCIGRGAKPAAAEDAAQSAESRAEHITPGPVQVVGRVIAVDMRTLTVVIELAPYAVLPEKFNGRPLISRRDDLRPTARLQASPYLRGRTLGARLVAGTPGIGHEVVLAPEEL